MAKDFAVKVTGLAELRRGLRHVEPELNKEIRVALRDAAGIVARQAALLAPRRTGALAASYKAFTRGNVAGVRSALPYAPIVEYGGTIRPRGVPIVFQRSLPVTRAAEREIDAVVQEIGDGFERAAARSGLK